MGKLRADTQKKNTAPLAFAFFWTSPVEKKVFLFCVERFSLDHEKSQTPLVKIWSGCNFLLWRDPILDFLVGISFRGAVVEHPELDQASGFQAGRVF